EQPAAPEAPEKPETPPVAETPAAPAPTAELPRTGTTGHAMLIGLSIVLVGLGTTVLLISGSRRENDRELSSGVFFADRHGENTPGPQDRRPTPRQHPLCVTECSEHRPLLTELSNNCQSGADLVYAVPAGPQRRSDPRVSDRFEPIETRGSRSGTHPVRS